MAGENRRLSREQRLLIARECTYFHTRKATRVLSDLFDSALRSYGLKGTQFSLLVAISLADNPTVSTIASILSADRTTMTRTLAPLERDGLIESLTGSDRRERRLSLTASGEELLVEASTAWRETQDEIVARMGEEQWHSLMTALSAVHVLGGE